MISDLTVWSFHYKVTFSSYDLQVICGIIVSVKLLFPINISLNGLSIHWSLYSLSQILLRK